MQQLRLWRRPRRAKRYSTYTVTSSLCPTVKSAPAAAAAVAQLIYQILPFHSPKEEENNKRKKNKKTPGIYADAGIRTEGKL